MRCTRRAALTAAALSAQSTDVLKIGIIGLGRRSGEHVKALVKTPNARVTALSDLQSARMQHANAQFGGRAAMYTDYRELLADKNVQAVVIVAPNHLHHEMAIAALRAGKDVLVEKPIALTYELARQVEREAQKHGRILAVGMQRRYFPMDVQIQQAVDSGALGAIRLITASDFRGDWTDLGWQYPDPTTGKKTNWRYLRKTAGSSELELSIHTFAMIMSLVKSPVTRVFASGAVAHYNGRETRDVSTALVEFANGVRLDYSFCLFAPGAGNSYAMIGDKASLRREQDRLMIASTGKPQPFTPTAPLPAEDAEVYLYRDFLESVRTRKPSALNAGFAIEASKIAWAIDRSIVENRIVDASREFRG